MNWLVSHRNIKLFIQSCCFPSKKEAMIKDNEFVDNENNNTNLNSNNEGSKSYFLLQIILNQK